MYWWPMRHFIPCIPKKKKGKKVSLALKLDISMAYDRVEWQFLQRIMKKMGFPVVWIERVISCVTTPSFSILVNEKSYGCTATNS